MQQILVTDSLFIHAEHEERLRAAGFEVVRLNKPDATEEELCEAVKGKVGYILGGMEKVTDKVIEAADSLKVIVFTGISYESFIPGWRFAKQKGIKLGSTPDGPTQAVAEWAVSAALVMNRGFFELQSAEGKSFVTTPGLQGLTIGIVGLGRIGTRIAEMLQAFQPQKLLYHSLHSHADKHSKLELEFLGLDSLLEQSDVVFLCVSDSAGQGYFGKQQFDNMKKGSLLVSFMHPGIIDEQALYEALKSCAVRAISDYPMSAQFKEFPKSHFYSFKASNAFNTLASLRLVSDMAVKETLYLLT